MVHPLLLALAALTIAHDAFGSFEDPLPPVAAALVVLLPLAVAWGAAHLVTAAAARRLDRAGSASALRLAESTSRALRTLAVVHAAVAYLVLGWLGSVRAAIGDHVLLDEALAAAPFLLTLVAAWWSFAPIERRLAQAAVVRALDEGRPLHPPPTRAALVLDKVRHGLAIGLVVIGVVFAWAESAVLIANALIDRGAWPTDPATSESLLAAMQLAVAPLILLGAPLLIRLFWDTVPMRDGELLRTIQDLCARHGVRFRRVLIWRTHGVVLNGAVVGFAGPLRYVLLTDALLERLPRRELEAVIAHEVAHVRRKHLPWLLASTAAAAGLAASAVLIPARWTASLASDPLREALATLGSGAATAVAAIVALLVFGFVSRRFERQADAFAVQDRSGLTRDDPASRLLPATVDAAGAMAGALRRVAVYNHVPLRRFGFRHGSIADRIRRLEGLPGTRLDRFPADRAVRNIKAATLAGLALVVALAVADALVTPPAHEKGGRPKATPMADRVIDQAGNEPGAVSSRP